MNALTDHRIIRLILSKRVTFIRDRMPGLYLRVHKASATWYHRADSGKFHRIARYPAMSIAQARLAIIENNTQRPAIKKLTITQIWNDYLSTLAGRTKTDAARFTDKLSPIANKTPAEITPAELLTIRDKELKRGVSTRTAGLPLVYLRAALRRAESLGVIPALAWRFPKLEGIAAKARQNFLKPSQIPEYMAWLDQQGDTVKDAVLFLMLTGCRAEERLKATIEGTTILIPDTKNGRTHRLPTTQTLQVKIAKSHWQTISSDRLSRHLAKAPQHIRVTQHDLRRTAANILADKGYPEKEISSYLNHTPQTVTARHYIQPNPERLLPMMQTIEEVIYV